MNMTITTIIDPLEASDRKRSNFIQKLVQNPVKSNKASSLQLTRPPKRIVRFWDDLKRIPVDVTECIKSWVGLETQGFELLLFDEHNAKNFIRNQLGIRHERAFDKCYHPAMKSDYFRLCYIYIKGGCYVDVDDVYCGNEIEHLFDDGKLKIQPLCYDVSTDKMVPLPVFAKPGADSLNWIFYFNNNPLIAAYGHPVIEKALSNATFALEQSLLNQLPEIQSTTGPGNLSKTIFDHASNTNDIENMLTVLHDWEDIAITKWSLSYRNDERNWRLSNRKTYTRSVSQTSMTGVK